MDGEGLVARYFGEEGVTLEYQDGKPVYLPHMSTSDNPDGTPGWMVGLEHSPIFHPDRPLCSGDDRMGAGQAVHQEDRLGLQQDRGEGRADVETVVTDTWKQYRAKFVLGELDASNGADWQGYLAALDKAGVDRLLAIYQGAYDHNY